MQMEMMVQLETDKWAANHSLLACWLLACWLIDGGYKAMLLLFDWLIDVAGGNGSGDGDGGVDGSGFSIDR
jgi:hypothetical protein